MASNYTSNYNLCQWQQSDKVLRTEFNADNAKIDAALAGLESSKAAASALDSLRTTVNGKANQSALNSLQTTVNGKANQSALDSLQTTVNGLASSKADKSALNSLSTTVTAQSTSLSLRNCRCVAGSYVGNGTYGSAHPNTITFPYKPVYVFVTGETLSISLPMIRGQQTSTGDFDTINGALTLSWGDRSVSWYTKATGATIGPSYQLNENRTYLYFAILELD